MKAQSGQFNDGEAPEYWNTWTPEEQEEFAQDHAAKAIKQEDADNAMRGAKKPGLEDFIPKDKPPF